MDECGLSFQEAINEAIRAGMTGPGGGIQPNFRTHDLGEPLVDVTKAVRLAGDLEDDELGRKLWRSSTLRPPCLLRP
jgi:hypothetical protein